MSLSKARQCSAERSPALAFQSPSRLSAVRVLVPLSPVVQPYALFAHGGFPLDTTPGIIVIFED